MTSATKYILRIKYFLPRIKLDIKNLLNKELILLLNKGGETLKIPDKYIYFFIQTMERRKVQRKEGKSFFLTLKLSSVLNFIMFNTYNDDYVLNIITY